MSNLLSKEARPHMRAFLQKRVLLRNNPTDSCSLSSSTCKIVDIGVEIQEYDVW